MSGNNITLKLGDTIDSGAPVKYSLGLIYQPGLLACITQLDLSRFPINGQGGTWEILCHITRGVSATKAGAVVD